ncbi:flavodoxin family protein [Companilactobacillus bobalius]|uniref:Flavodoxin-like domain-containing protein n=2 Tax=Companilactobacillus bobalius TaxID=2801451 RepID=A0A202FFD0_9LACO|nr:flavodoxin [Companilactobacillus bobalius]KAE9560379.1 flavodoxin [Companilactobacillus bobalius]KRK83126.1 flavodoxin [Companilactobacillus bobalius DSM 19674]OVE99185.1 hypothetical protein LKACC16343_00297 [Companilactobacillus bobalius]GEO57161.1 flavodoxin [Companilactobacillus paralimentarius]
MRSSLGPIVGKINNKNIYANQLLRKNNAIWEGGRYTPSDGSDTQSGGTVKKLTQDAKSIVIYWSRSGSTELLASKIASITNSDILQITLKEPYPADYLKTRSRANFERENNIPPELNMELPKLDQYHTVFLGYQTWAMTLSQPMKAFLLKYGSKLSGKVIAPFETQGGFGRGDSIDIMERIVKQKGSSNNLFEPLLMVNGNMVDQADEKIEQWINTFEK